MKKYPEQLVFGLDIGTRSIVGTVGYREKDKFIVLAQRSKEHETRAMLDGQIHDIKKVSETIAEVKEELEETLGIECREVCIAAAGRVLRTVTTSVQNEFLTEKEVTPKKNETEERIKAINPLEMTPMEALNLLYELNKEVKNKK